MDFFYDPSLVLYLPLYELDGASFMAKDKHGHLCTVTGALWRPDGHYFDGSDDRIDCGASTNFNVTAQLTLGCWFKPVNAQAGNIRCPLIKQNAYQLTYDHSSADYRGNIAIKADSTWYHGGGAVTISPGNWHHCVGVYDGTDLITYLEGQEVKRRNIGRLTIATSTDKLWVAYTGSGVEYLNASVGEVWVFSRALTPQEIQRNYLATKWRYQ